MRVADRHVMNVGTSWYNDGATFGNLTRRSETTTDLPWAGAAANGFLCFGVR